MVANDPNPNVWFDEYVDESEEADVVDYDLSATPNDFNVSTLFSFIESRAIVIPGFQRNYVWDLTRASKLIESLILGLPVPQLFLYEEARNRFLVIDGQQRLMSIYYFIKQRFPRNDARADIRRIFEDERSLPDEVIHDDQYFTNFRLKLPAKLPDRPNPLAGLGYATLGDKKFSFDLRPIRNVVVKQNSPSGDDSSIYEIFSRLNSGGVNLTPQEIRLSLYHSLFYESLMRMNSSGKWRRIIGDNSPDLHLKDVEILLRIFAMLVDGENYSPSMVKFLNQFSKKCRAHDRDQNAYLEALFNSFLGAAAGLPANAFINKKSNRFNIALIEAVFTAVCTKAFSERRLLDGEMDKDEVGALETDSEFIQAASYATTQTLNVKKRMERGKALIRAL